MLQSYALFFFAALGSFNGLALSTYLLWREPVSRAQQWLGVLVLMLSLRTGKSVVYFFWPQIPKIYLQLGLTACFLIGLCLLGFVRAWADPRGERTRRDKLWLALVAAAALGFGWAFPYAEYRDLWRWHVIHVIELVWLACLLLSAWVFFRNRAQTPMQSQVESAGQVQAASRLLRRAEVGSVIVGVALIWLAYATVGFTSYIVGALTFTVLLYFSAMVAFTQRGGAVGAAELSGAAPQLSTEPYQDRKIEAEQAERDLTALHALMAHEQLYQQANLTLPKLARRLGMPPARLSQLLNDNHKTPFKQYLTQWRIKAAKQLLQAKDPLPMERIAEATGFLSMSTFYSSFKKAEGTTPAAWRAGLSTQPDS
jgi:AraC-like DNA-binding protein